MRKGSDGTAAEVKFKDWLDWSEAAYMYVDQQPDTFAADFADNTKRPDFLVGIPQLGTIAVDVKDKATSNDCFYFDVDEHERMAEFEFAFGMPVWFVIMRPRSVRTYFIPNQVLGHCARSETKSGPAITVHFDDLTRCDPQKTTFYEALYQATCLKK